jgi:hypothetical protein
MTRLLDLATAGIGELIVQQKMALAQ